MVGISIESVVKRFGQAKAVDDVSLRIRKGELFFLLGPSGCGKTTLLRILAGFYRPDEGRILFDDRDITDVAPHKRNTGMVFQNYALWPHMTVADNLSFGLEMHHVPAAETKRRVDEALELVQMRDYASRWPNQLSGGQQQRVAVARALALEPDVVLLDEPLANLDAKLRLDMRQQIRRIHQELGLTMVYVTHDQEEALSMADRITIMVDGRVVQVGTPREIYNRPASRFVADFIGEANLLAGTICAVGQQITVETTAGELVSSVEFEGAKVGDSVTCSIRPEGLDVLGPGQDRANVLTGQVTRTVYLGDHEQYFVRCSDGAELRVVEYKADAPKAEVGASIRLGCEASDVVILEDA